MQHSRAVKVCEEKLMTKHCNASWEHLAVILILKFSAFLTQSNTALWQSTTCRNVFNLPWWHHALRNIKLGEAQRSLALAAMPVLSPMRPNKICSVPTKLWPSLLASSWANITTLIAFSVNLSNIIDVTFLLLTGLRLAVRLATNPGALTCPKLKLDLKPVKVVKTMGSCLDLAPTLCLGGARTLHLVLLVWPKTGMCCACRKLPTCMVAGLGCVWVDHWTRVRGACEAICHKKCLIWLQISPRTGEILKQQLLVLGLYRFWKVLAQWWLAISNLEIQLRIRHSLAQPWLCLVTSLRTPLLASLIIPSYEQWKIALVSTLSSKKRLFALPPCVMVGSRVFVRWLTCPSLPYVMFYRIDHPD